MATGAHRRARRRGTCCRGSAPRGAHTVTARGAPPGACRLPGRPTVRPLVVVLGRSHRGRHPPSVDLAAEERLRRRGDRVRVSAWRDERRADVVVSGMVAPDSRREAHRRRTGTRLRLHVRHPLAVRRFAGRRTGRCLDVRGAVGAADQAVVGARRRAADARHQPPGPRGAGTLCEPHRRRPAGCARRPAARVLLRLLGSRAAGPVVAGPRNGVPGAVRL